MIQVSNTLDLDSSAALNSLAKESATETSMMRQLATKSTQDAAAVKVLTVLALIYLPFTVVMVRSPSRTKHAANRCRRISSQQNLCNRPGHLAVPLL